jgi:hypothetical protein
MDVTSTQGALPADSPTAPTEHAPQSLDSFRAMLSGDDDDNDADSSPADADGHQDPQQEPEAKAEGEAEPEEKKADEDQPKEKTRQRMERLLKDRAEALQEAAQIKEKAAAKELRLSLALKTVMAKLTATNERLSQYEDMDTADHRLADMESRQQVQAEYRRQEQALRARAEQEREQALVGNFRSQLEESISDALEGFPTVTREQLLARFKEHAEANQDVTFDAAPDIFKKLATGLDEEMFARYESRVLERHKPKLSAPRPISSRGAVPGPPSRLRTVDEMAEDADAAFGSKWGGR